MKIPILKIPYTEEEITEVQEGIADVMRSGILSGGEVVKQLEREWAAYCGTKYAVACTSGTAALEMILRAVNVEGKDVVIPSNTMMATAMAVIHARGRVVLADCARHSLQPGLKEIMEAEGKNTAAIIIVHIGGVISPDIKDIRDYCNEYNISLVEDACHAHGSGIKINNRMFKAGNIGLAGAFSFYPTKVLTCGESGIITTNDNDLYYRCCKLRDFYRLNNNPQMHVGVGYNWRMDEFRAVLALQQVRKIDKVLAERRQIAEWYDSRHEWDNHNALKSSYYKYMISLNNRHRNLIRQKATDYDIALPGLVYEIPLHQQPIMEYGITDKFPNTDIVSSTHLCLPLYLGMTEDEVDYVINSIKEILS